MKRELTCIICPKGCSMVAHINGTQVEVTGNTCPKGKEYAINECLHPVRTLTATLRISNRHDTMVSVKTDLPIPKDNMMEAMALLRAVSVNAPIHIGDTLMEDVFGSRIIATKAVE